MVQRKNAKQLQDGQVSNEKKLPLEESQNVGKEKHKQTTKSLQLHYITRRSKVTIQNQGNDSGQMKVIASMKNQACVTIYHAVPTTLRYGGVIKYSVVFCCCLCLPPVILARHNNHPDELAYTDKYKQYFENINCDYILTRDVALLALLSFK